MPEAPGRKSPGQHTPPRPGRPRPRARIRSGLADQSVGEGPLPPRGCLTQRPRERSPGHLAAPSKQGSPLRRWTGCAAASSRDSLQPRIKRGQHRGTYPSDAIEMFSIAQVGTRLACLPEAQRERRADLGKECPLCLGRMARIDRAPPTRWKLSERAPTCATGVRMSEDTQGQANRRQCGKGHPLSGSPHSDGSAPSPVAGESPVGVPAVADCFDSRRRTRLTCCATDS